MGSFLGLLRGGAAAIIPGGAIPIGGGGGGGIPGGAPGGGGGGVVKAGLGGALAMQLAADKLADAAEAERAIATAGSRT